MTPAKWMENGAKSRVERACRAGLVAGWDWNRYHSRKSAEESELAGGFPDAKMAIPEGAGHMVMLAQPDQFNEAIKQFQQSQIRSEWIISGLQRDPRNLRFAAFPRAALRPGY